MKTNRTLTSNELNYISQYLINTKKQLLWLFSILVVVVIVGAILIYTTVKANFIINLIFGILVFLIGILYRFFKGYKNHKLNPIVYSGKGVYKLKYNKYSSRGTYIDTINGQIVKIPWHWRSYLKKQNAEIAFEYITRDGAVAVNESSIYVIAVNNTLSLDNELKMGLNKIKPISILNVVSLFALPIVILMAFSGNTMSKALRIFEVTKNPSEDVISLKTAKDLALVTTSNYIQIDSAWVYQYNPTSSYYDEHYIITKDERDRIYNHPNANFNYRLFTPKTYPPKPNKAQLKENLLNNSVTNNRMLKSIDSSLVNTAIENIYKKQVEAYNLRVKQTKSKKALLKALKPKSYILKVDKALFNAPSKSLNSIAESLEHTYKVFGYFNVETGKLITIQEQEKHKKAIKEAFILISICLPILVIGVISLIKIIRNSVLKLGFVKQQLAIANRSLLD